ncbi:MAG: FAD binding domain-containing protein [Anaerolineales bacterium]|nr:FAD binding domain-containing protein [Anaerolineales bacterium]
MNPPVLTNPNGQQNFYIRPDTMNEALALLNDPALNSCVLAGGTDLVNHFRSEGKPDCDRVVDVTGLLELQGIRQDGDEIIIGAALTHTDIVNSALLQERAPILVQACRQIGSPQIRNVATIGGNVVNAAACADTLPPLVCLEADVVVATPEGDKRMAVNEFVSGVNRTRLERGSLFGAFIFNAPPKECRSAYQRIGRRRAMSIARLSLAAMAVQEEDGTISLIRLAPGAAFSRFSRISVVEEFLIEQRPTAALLVEAGKRMAQVLMAESGGRWSAPYKELTIAALTERALRQVLDV